MTTAPSPNNFFFFNDTATTEIYTLSLHDALPISLGRAAAPRARHRSLVADRNGLAGGSELCRPGDASGQAGLVRRSEEHTSELQSQSNLVCRLLLEKKKKHKCSCATALPGVSSLIRSLLLRSPC